MTNVLILSPCSQKHLKLLKLAGGNDSIISVIPDNLPPEKLKAELTKADVIIGQPDVQLIKDLPKLKLLQLTMAGTDKYTQDNNYPKDVILANASGAFGPIISQYIMGVLLNICHKLYHYRDNQKIGLWEDEGTEISLYNKRVLIVGAGDIGSNTAKKLSAFDTYTVGIRRNTAEIPPYFSEIHTLDKLNEQLPLADAVICCIPNSDYTYHLFDEEKFRLMKKNAIFINVGRGALVVQEDLIHVMKDGHLAGAAIDVTTPEPLPNDSELWSVDNLIITPHISGVSFGHDESITDKIYNICAENLLNFTNGRPLRNIIDFKKFRK